MDVYVAFSPKGGWLGKPVRVFKYLSDVKNCIKDNPGSIYRVYKVDENAKTVKVAFEHRDGDCDAYLWYEPIGSHVLASDFDDDIFIDVSEYNIE